LRWSLLAYLVFQTGNYASFSFIGSWLAKDFGASQTAIGKAMMMIGLGTALGSILGPRLVARAGERRSLWVGILVQGAFYLLAAAMPPEWVLQWAERGFDLQVREISAEEFDKQCARADAVPVRDAGYTEVDPGSLTVVAVPTP